MITGFYRYYVEEQLIEHSPAVHVESSAPNLTTSPTIGWSVRTSLSQQCVLLHDNRRREDLTVAERNLEDLRYAAALDRWSLT